MVIIMLKRELYLQKIRPFYKEVSLIKILYGLRRSGKSIILTQIMDELKENKIKEEQIIYINFESLEYNFIAKDIDLYNYVKGRSPKNKICYLFLDEIQKVENFEKAINSLRITNNYSIFITGSNSRLTFSELSTDLTGRYVSFKINPLTYKEAIQLMKVKREDYDTFLYDMLEWGGLPQRFSFIEDNNKLNYISDVYNSIILKDVVERLKIKDVTTFNKIVEYLLDTEGREFSSKNVLEYLKKENTNLSSQTLYNYLEALCSVFIVNKVYRYDIEGKAVLKTLNKYYVSDLGIKKIKNNNAKTNYSICLENLIYNDLIVKGYKVYIGKTKKGEIDFIALKNKEVKYIQVSLYLENETTLNREFGAFANIQDNYAKYVISLDKEDKSQDGITHLNVIDFLLNDDF